MIMIVADLTSWACIVVGSLFAITGGIGIHRFPDFFTRLHAAGVTDTMGAVLILVGLMVQAGWTLIAVKLFLVLGFLMFTSPTATHALAKAAIHGKLRPVLAPPPE